MRSLSLLQLSTCHLFVYFSCRTHQAVLVCLELQVLCAIFMPSCFTFCISLRDVQENCLLEASSDLIQAEKGKENNVPVICYLLFSVNHSGTLWYTNTQPLIHKWVNDVRRGKWRQCHKTFLATDRLFAPGPSACARCEMSALTELEPTEH